MHDLIVLGGGPAGLTAMVYALRRRLDALLISRDLGGQTNYRMLLPEVSHHLVITGEEVVNRFANEIEYLDFARVMDSVERVEAEQVDGQPAYTVHTRTGQSYQARALIVATGATPRRMKVPGEAEYSMRGVVYSAVSYASLFVDGVTAVVGASELALQSAAELARVARRVTVVGVPAEALGDGLGRHLSRLGNVTLLPGYAVESVFGDEYARGLIVTKGDERREIAADAIFVELGLVANARFLGDLVARDANKRIVVDARNQTSAPGVFAAGDVTDVYAEQVLVAVGEGAKAALSAYNYLLAHPASEHEVAQEWR